MTGHRGRRRAAAGAVLVAVCGLAFAGCGTSPDASGYREQARLAVGTALSEVRTAELLLRAEDDGKTLGGYPTTVLGSSGDSLATTESSFSSLLPPVGEDRTGARTSELLHRAGEDVGAATLAQHRDERASYPALVHRLERTATELERWQEELR